MRQQLGLTWKLAQYIMGKKMRGEKQYPIVMMLEPLHTCNLACLGCTPDRWDGPMSEWLSVERCLEGVDESGAPIVSVCGGEPLVYKEIHRLLDGLYDRGVYTILCTNALLLPRFLDKAKFSPYLSFAIHLDGLEKTHDMITKHPGCFRKAIDASKRALDMGFRVTSNTTVFTETSVDEVCELFTYLKEDVGYHALLVSPGYDFDQTGDNIFLKRAQVQERFRTILSRCNPRWFGNSNLYLEFLQGHKELTCTAWGNPVLTPKGWQGPCYMLRDGYYPTYHEMVAKTDWTKYGPESTDPRCANCMVHCGFEPTVATGRGLSAYSQVVNGFKSLV